MAKRPIVEIDRKKCNGCGLCTTACAEGALILDEENKAVLVKEIYCDGLGKCLDVCPVGALKVVEREGETYDPKKTRRHVKALWGEDAAARVHDPDEAGGKTAGPSGCACPGSRPREIPRPNISIERGEDTASALGQWPIQLRLISPLMPAFQGCELLIAADCTAFSLGGFHPRLLRGRKLVIACPKLDDSQGYVEKLAELFKQNDIRSLTLAVMTVPCCSGLKRMVEQALSLSGKEIPLDTVTVDVNGTIAVSPLRG